MEEGKVEIDKNDAYAAIRQIDAEMKAKEIEASNAENPNKENVEDIAAKEAASKQKGDADKAAELAATEAANKSAAENKEESKESWEDIVSKNFEAQTKAEDEAKKQARLAKAEENPLIKSIIDTHLDGGDVKALLKDVDAVDPKTLDEKTLFELTLPKGLSEDEKEVAYDKFMDLHESTKSSIVESKRNDLIKRQEEISKSLNNNSGEILKGEYKKAMDAIHSAVKEINGTTIKGVGISDRLAAEIFTTATKQLRANQNNNNFNQEQSFKDAITLVTAPYIEEAAKKQGYEKGKVEAVNEFHNPSAKNDVNSTSTKVEKTKAEMDIDATEAYTKQFS